MGTDNRNWRSMYEDEVAKVNDLQDQVEILTNKVKHLESVQVYDELENEHLKLSADYEMLKDYVEHQRERTQRLVGHLQTIKLMLHSTSPIHLYIRNVMKRKDEEN